MLFLIQKVITANQSLSHSGSISGRQYQNAETLSKSGSRNFGFISCAPSSENFGRRAAYACQLVMGNGHENRVRKVRTFDFRVFCSVLIDMNGLVQQYTANDE